jgi:hypothetical protein
MEDLIRLIVQQVNITEEQARQTVNTILGYVRDRLPEPMAEQVQSFLASGGASSIPGVADLMKGFGDIMQSMGGTMPGGGSASTSDGTDLAR